MKIWFTSDLHFAHRNIVKFTNRGVDTSQENHDQWLTDVWNSQVKPGDTVFHLGDFSFAKGSWAIAEQLQKLNGQKFCIKGNHCSSSVWKQVNREQRTGLIKFTQYEERFFNVEKLTQPQLICLFHFPMISWHRQHRNAWHLHGHTHGDLNPDFAHGKILDVGLDNAYLLYGKHVFFDLDMIRDYMQTRQVVIADQHQQRPGEM